MADIPATRYVKSDDVHIAYQVIGDGPRDLLFVPGFVSNLEALWQSPARTAFFCRLARFARIIMFDKRGTGMSDRGSQIFTLEQRMHDVQAVLDQVGSRRATLFGISEGGPMSLLYAATYPERTSALVLYGTYARRSWAPDYTFAWTDAQWSTFLDDIEHHWGTTDAMSLLMWAPSVAGNKHAVEQIAAYFRASASPGAASAIMRMNRDIDVRDILPVTRVPTLILHRTDDRVIDVKHARYMGQRIPRAKLIELNGEDHMVWVGNQDAILDEVEEFVTGHRQTAEPDRVLATVLFVDIAGSTERAAALGDGAWHVLLDAFYAKARGALGQYRGREINTAGDGFLATFDGPARAVRCASAIRDAVRPLDLKIRCGLHTGECEFVAHDIVGIAVHIGARVAALAAPGEVLVSQTVRDLVAGSGLAFEEKGTHLLKGVPDRWRLFRAVTGERFG
ncbi:MULTISPECIES: adenylate/guanylate cyclase domain-containing protein [Bradyrhizobium]|uniref:Pimeloyl-ACP methyl ester carboxylesterase n=2 Tax=Bradyrhizobium ottawaense TaxID=931866 RepID=A0ABV4G1P1_9BRAD|nr:MULTISPECIES: adenylate/guanylate cyclase domain-containing protein [Bradyrhizobium]MBR1294869.1 adenylate/guanylate cyclase domain-containing protein [Bradyrhizobium ottawaense]MBR1330550.1 adenylate/guanylate cyclase domain-containing protein [Bradyrhizobium ottawaense]MBR1337019.1 adenylate/guanylate cyclase domain-containing protein [Bradyrhizobium ottawaense]MDA9481504.1 hydrolase [Bradyrhizobium sp. CCBAU 11445]WLB43094.1 adenylate/guanylate cyclase domain-containing protein [Bradyrhi